MLIHHFSTLAFINYRLTKQVLDPLIVKSLTFAVSKLALSRLPGCASAVSAKTAHAPHQCQKQGQAASTGDGDDERSKASDPESMSTAEQDPNEQAPENPAGSQDFDCGGQDSGIDSFRSYWGSNSPRENKDAGWNKNERTLKVAYIQIIAERFDEEMERAMSLAQRSEDSVYYSRGWMRQRRSQTDLAQSIGWWLANVRPNDMEPVVNAVVWAKPEVTDDRGSRPPYFIKTGRHATAAAAMRVRMALRSAQHAVANRRTISSRCKSSSKGTLRGGGSDGSDKTDEYLSC